MACAAAAGSARSLLVGHERADGHASTTTAAAPAHAVSPSVQQSQLPVEHNELSERGENRYFGADSGHAFSHKTDRLRVFPTLFRNQPNWNSHPRRVSC